MDELDVCVAVPATTLWISPGSTRLIDDAIVRPGADPAAWAASLGHDERLDLHGRVHSQLLLGEPVVVLDERAGWAEVCAPWQPGAADDRGYRGWLRWAHLGVAPRRTGLEATVSVRSTTLVVEEGEIAVSWGTTLPMLERSGSRVVVGLPNEQTGVLAPEAVTVRELDVRALDSSAPVRSARQFLGLDYLWGGTTGWGLDCSGLVHLAFRSHGVMMPRDAADQRRACARVALGDVVPGDLYFFGREGRVTHVGFATSPGSVEPRTMLHAPEESRYVEDVSLSPDRLSALVGAGRVTNPTWLPGQNSF